MKEGTILYLQVPIYPIQFVSHGTAPPHFVKRNRDTQCYCLIEKF